MKVACLLFCIFWMLLQEVIFKPSAQIPEPAPAMVMEFQSDTLPSPMVAEIIDALNSGHDVQVEWRDGKWRLSKFERGK